MKKVDACGTSCPQPVLMTQKALKDKPDSLEVLVDNTSARDNVTRFLTNQGYSVSVTEENDLFILKAMK